MVGLIDLGTNSLRLLVVQINSNGSYNILLKHKEMVRLGEGAYLERNSMTPEAMDRTLAAMTMIAKLCSDLGAEEIIAVATAATRDAENAEEFIARVKRETGIDLRVIPGKEEARLIYTGVASGIPLGERNALFIDIGGGSTEVSLGTASKYLFLESLDCGCVRYTDRFFGEGYSKTVSAADYRRICDQLRKNAIHTLTLLKGYKIDLAVGSSGTIENLAEIALRSKAPNQRMERLPLEERKLNYDDLVAVAQKLCSLPLAKRRQIPGINPKRADVIVAGAAIIQTLMEELGQKEIWVSDLGLQHGLLLDFMRRSHRGLLDDTMSVREFSVLQLAKRGNTQEKHAEHVAKLALEIFDSATVSKLIPPPGSEERELLRYAALLHDVGTLLSLRNHHAHSHYFIRNSELLGFYTREIETIAASAYYHGKKSFRPKGLLNLPPDMQLTAQRNGAIIRVCEALDRTHRSLIASAKLLTPKGQYVLSLEASSKNECSVEIAAAKEALPLLKNIFGKNFTLHFVTVES